MSVPRHQSPVPSVCMLAVSQVNILGAISQKVCLWVHDWNSLCFNYELDDPIRSQICACHDSWAVMTCAKLWSDWIIIIHVTGTWMFARFGLWAHKRVVSWVLVHSQADTYHNINTLRPRQNGRHFPDDIFKWIFLNENVWISINISLKFVPRGSINNIPTLVQVMAWHRPGDKPLSGLIMVRLPTHICVARPQWVNVHSISNLTRNIIWHNYIMTV